MNRFASQASMLADYVVVGAGLVGASIAWGLARAGATVIVFDAGEDRLHASAGNFGLVWVQGKGATVPDYAQLTRRSADAWAVFASELSPEESLQHRQCGGVKIALSEEELSRFATALDRHHNDPHFIEHDTRLIDQQELRELVPKVGPDAIGGTWCPHDGHADSLATLRALHQQLEQHPNISIVRQCVEHVDPSSSVAPFIVTAAGTHVLTEHVVLAAGLGNQALASDLGLLAPIRPERGQILVTERTETFLDIACHNVRQTGDGTVLLGDSHEDVGLDTGVTQQVTHNILQRAVRTFPHLAQLRLQRTWGALRVLSLDGLPIYQCSKAYPGASLITCHSGVTLAAAHASEVANALLEDRLNDTYSAFSAERFECAA